MGLVYDLCSGGMSDRLHDLSLFVRVAETGSFSRAARETGLAQPTVSRIVAALEARLGVRLMVRTTRAVTLTEAGSVLLERARAVLAEVEAMEGAVRGGDTLLGVLRVAVPVTFGAGMIVPRLGPFLAAHPGLRLELMMADRVVDLVAEGVDLAIRLGRLHESGLVARRLGASPRRLLASPGYLARRGMPQVAADLGAHDVIFNRPPGTDVWTLRDPAGAEVSVRLTARLIATAVEGAVAAARAGLGIALLSDFASGEAQAGGALVPVLGDHALAPVEVHALIAAGRRPPAKVRAFLDHLARTLGPG